MGWLPEGTLGTRMSMSKERGSLEVLMQRTVLPFNVEKILLAFSDHCPLPSHLDYILYRTYIIVAAV